MGNICGKQEADPFAQPGRPLGAAPTPAKSAPVPSTAGKRTVGGPPRTLGGGGGGSSSGEGNANPSDARRKAAEAAEVSSCSSRSQA